MSEPVKHGMENPGVLDAIAHDTRTDEVVLAMFETRPWSGEDWQLFQLQEKLNAYVSFALDGEMAESYPEFVNKKLRIQLRCIHEPDDRTLAFCERVREQLSLQDIPFDIVLIEKDSCGDSCTCRH